MIEGTDERYQIATSAFHCILSGRSRIYNWRDFDPADDSVHWHIEAGDSSRIVTHDKTVAEVSQIVTLCGLGSVELEQICGGKIQISNPFI